MCRGKSHDLLQDAEIIQLLVLYSPFLYLLQDRIVEAPGSAFCSPFLLVNFVWKKKTKTSSVCVGILLTFSFIVWLRRMNLLSQLFSIKNKFGYLLLVSTTLIWLIYSCKSLRVSWRSSVLRVEISAHLLDKWSETWICW